MNRLNKFFFKNIKIIKHNQGTTKLLTLLVLFIIFREPIDNFIMKYFHDLSLVKFSIIYFILALFLLPTLPITLMASSLYTPIDASIYIAFTITLVALVQVNFPQSFGLGIKDDRYISYLAKNLSLRSRLDKFNFFFLARHIPFIPLAVTSAFAIKIFIPNCKINLFLFLAAYFLGTLSMTFLVIKLINIL